MEQHLEPSIQMNKGRLWSAVKKSAALNYKEEKLILSIVWDPNQPINYNLQVLLSPCNFPK